MNGFESAVFSFLASASNRLPIIDALIVLVSRYLPYALVLSALFVIFVVPDWRQRLLRLAEAVLSLILARGIVVESVRFFYDRPRPFEVLSLTPLIEGGGASFPSGHAAFFFALGTAIFFMNRMAGKWLLLLSAAVGVARIAAGVHWPLDVIAGAGIGVVSALLMRWLLRPYMGAPQGSA